MRWIKALFRRHELEQQLDRELRFHIEQQIEDLIAKGLSRDEARRRTMLAFGGPDLVKEQCRDERGVRWIEDLWRDLAYGARLLRSSPVFTLVAVMSLALGIGANTAIFSLLDTVMLRSMPVVEPGRLVEFMTYRPPYGRGAFSYPLFDKLRAQSRSFAGIFVHSSVSRTEIGFGSEEELVRTAMASADYYTTLGVPALVGRTFSREEERAAVAVISYAYWQRRFEGDPKVIGKTFRLHGTVFTIIGVTPKDFFGPIVGRAPEVTFPVKMDDVVRGDESTIEKPDYGWLKVMGRLKPETSRERAQAEISGLFQQGLELEASKVKLRDKKEILDQRIELRPAGNGFADLSERYAEPLLALMGVVALVLLIACSNLANLLLARDGAPSRWRMRSRRTATGCREWEGELGVVRYMVEDFAAACFRAMELITILNRCRRFLGVVYWHARLSPAKSMLVVAPLGAALVDQRQVFVALSPEITPDRRHRMAESFKRLHRAR